MVGNVRIERRGRQGRLRIAEKQIEKIQDIIGERIIVSFHAALRMK
jgi:ppGpp synthetase/RelA/SpoT-type nucleotidyltranferase